MIYSYNISNITMKHCDDIAWRKIRISPTQTIKIGMKHTSNMIFVLVISMEHCSFARLWMSHGKKRGTIRCRQMVDLGKSGMVDNCFYRTRLIPLVSMYNHMQPIRTSKSISHVYIKNTKHIHPLVPKHGNGKWTFPFESFIHEDFSLPCLIIKG